MFKRSALYLHLARYARMLLALVLLVLLTGGGTMAYADSPGSHSAPSIQATHLLALDGGGVLAWSAVGAAQLRTAEGAWLPAFQMPMRDVLHVIHRGNGFLALGLPGPKEPAATFPVVAYDNDGREAGRWSVPPSWSLAANGTDAWVMSNQEMQIPLLPGGELGSPVPVPLWNGQPPRDPRFAATPLRWHRFDWHDITVYCHDADITKQSHALARCHRAASPGWAQVLGDRFGGHVDAACGPWLLAWGGGRDRHDRRGTRMTIIDLRSGKPSGQRDIQEMPAISCAGEDQLLLANGKHLELLALPDLKTRWRSPRLPGAVVAVAATGHEFVYRLGSRSGVRTMARPTE